MFQTLPDSCFDLIGAAAGYTFSAEEL